MQSIKQWFSITKPHIIKRGGRWFVVAPKNGDVAEVMSAMNYVSNLNARNNSFARV